MKIEMGESLFFSWLRHIKDCQIVQSNWTTSPHWTLKHENELQEIMEQTDRLFQEKYGYSIYKKNASLSQVLQQAECDVLGISVKDDGNKTYAVDVAFHRDGLAYRNRKETVSKIIIKCLRTAMCIYGYLNTKEAEVIFASPKVSKGILEDVTLCISDAQALMGQLGYKFSFRIIANAEFRELVLKPVLLVSDEIKDTNELFMRSYQMVKMFDLAAEKNVTISSDEYSELKIGKIVQVVLRRILETGKIDKNELLKLQDKTYCKETFNINFPLLVSQEDEYNKARYYVEPVTIKNTKYMLCSQWVEKDRMLLLNWINKHK